MKQIKNLRRSRLQAICLDCQRQYWRLSEVLVARATEVCFVVVRAAVKPPFLKEARFLLRICAQLPPKNIRRSTTKAKALRFNRYS